MRPQDEQAVGAAAISGVLATGRSMTDVDREWRDRLESSPLWLKAVVSDTSLLAITGLLFALGFWRFRRRKKDILAQWEEEEASRDLLYDRVIRYWEHEEPTIIDVEISDVPPTNLEPGSEEEEIHPFPPKTTQ